MNPRIFIPALFVATPAQLVLTAQAVGAADPTAVTIIRLVGFIAMGVGLAVILKRMFRGR